METRLVCQSDAEILASLHLSVFEHGQWTEHQFETCLSLSSTRGWLTFQGARLVGFLLCQKVADESEILTFCVASDVRRRHIGADLLTLGRTKLLGEGVKRLFLEVAADNDAALALYKQQGFKVIGQRKSYYKQADHFIDALILEYRQSFS